MSTDFKLSTSGMEGWNGTKLGKAVPKAMRRWGNEWLALLVSERMSGKGQGVIPRTGNLSRDWNAVATADATGATLTVATHGTADAYARLQEYGGTVRPKTAKWLWIPLDANRTPSGVPRVTPSQAIEQGGFISFKRGPVFFSKPLVKTAKKNTVHGLVPLFVLKKEVYVPGRLGARGHFRDNMPKLAAILASTIKGAMNGND